jgi:hypothetical protein
MDIATIASIVMCVLGVFILAAAVFDWQWALTRRRGRPLADRTRARVIYAILGLALIVWNGLRIIQALSK